MFIDQNTADTLNKALDLAKQGVVAGFEQVKQLAPFVWNVARRQTQIDGIELVMVAFLTFVAWLAVNIMSYREWKDQDSNWVVLFCSSRSSLCRSMPLIFSATQITGR